MEHTWCELVTLFTKFLDLRGILEPPGRLQSLFSSQTFCEQNFPEICRQSLVTCHRWDTCWTASLLNIEGVNSGKQECRVDLLTLPSTCVYKKKQHLRAFNFDYHVLWKEDLFSVLSLCEASSQRNFFVNWYNVLTQVVRQWVQRIPQPATGRVWNQKMVTMKSLLTEDLSVGEPGFTLILLRVLMIQILWSSRYQLYRLLRNQAFILLKFWIKTFLQKL